MPHSPEASARKRTVPKLRIALVGDRVDWHARELTKALAELGVGANRVSLQELRFAPDGRCGLSIPGFSVALPDAVFVRSMSGGSFEAVTLQQGQLHSLRTIDVPVCNEARDI